jgi:hypothetical protein
VLSLSRNVATMASARTAFDSIPSIAPQPAPRVLLDSDRKDRWPAGPKRADASRAPTLTTRSIKCLCRPNTLQQWAMRVKIVQG